MAGDPKNPIIGEFVFDGAEFEAYAIDLPPGGCQGMLTTREGFLDVCQEIVTNHAEWGAKAGVPEGDMKDLVTANERIARIDVFLPALLKAVEVLTETRYVLDDQRQRIAFNGAQSIDRRLKSHPDLLAKYQKTREYRSAIAKKALRTKEKNAEAAETEGGETEEQPPAPVQPPASVST